MVPSAARIGQRSSSSRSNSRSKSSRCVLSLVLPHSPFLSGARSRLLLLFGVGIQEGHTSLTSLCLLPCQERTKAEAAGRVQAVAERAAKAVQDCDREQHWPSKRTEVFPPGTFSLTPDALRAVRKAFHKGPPLLRQGGDGEEDSAS